MSIEAPATPLTLRTGEWSYYVERNYTRSDNVFWTPIKPTNMASTFSTDLALELVATGEKAGLWGSITNTNLQILQQSATGVVMFL